MSAIKLHHIVKHYDNRTILHGIDLDVNDGEFVALVGPSGCGKSTLLRTIAGLEPMSSGTITLGQRVLNDVAPKDRDMAMVFQNYALYPHMTVRDNLGFALKIKGVDKHARAERVAQIAATLGLAQELDRYPRQLSGGQRQRVAMGRAIVRQPAAFLFDEPLSNLDAKLRIQMRTEIKALHQKLRATTIYVTHDQVEAMTMADRIVVLRNGRIEQQGTPLQLYDRPVNTFVAGFIGSPAMNLIRGTLQTGERPCVLSDDGFQLPIGPVPSTVQPGQPVIYGIRPEHVHIVSEPGIEARVTVVEPTGAETHVAARLGTTALLISLRDRFTQAPDSPLFIMPEVKQVHLFDADTGYRLN